MYMSTARTMAPGKQRPWATTPAATCVRKTPRRGPSGRRVHPSQTCQRARGATWAKKNAHVLLTHVLLLFLLLLLLPPSPFLLLLLLRLLLLLLSCFLPPPSPFLLNGVRKCNCWLGGWQRGG